MAFAVVLVFALATAGHSLWRPPAAAVASLVPRHSPAVAAAPRPSRDVSRKAKALGTKGVAPSVEKQKHLLFDRVELTVRGGDGGDGVVVPPSGRHAARLSSGLESDLELPPGGDGGDVVLYVDPSLSDLLPLHARPKLTGERGRDSPGPLTTREVAQRAVRDSGDGSAAGVQRQQLHGAALRVGVPPGTFVRTGGGRVLGDLVSAGDEVRVAEGGAGGPCIVGAARGRAARRQQSEARRGGRRRSGEEVDAFELSEQEELDLVRGKAAPPPTKLLLLLRTVADVGFVGFPNAGKSTLLNALTRARATINSYPFTTLMPNLGAMVPSGGEGGGGGGGGTLLADLPGLVEGAHAGRGLGRQFLQQLRRVKVVLFVLDTTCAEVDVGEQYAILRRELQLYNPDYLARPHLVALNKLDTLLEAEGPAALAPETRRLTALLAAAARASAAPGDGPPTPPLAVLPISGMKGKGLRALQEAIAAALADHPTTLAPEGESDPPHPQ